MPPMLVNIIRTVLPSISLFFFIAFILYMSQGGASEALPTMIVQTGTQVVRCGTALADVVLGYAQIAVNAFGEIIIIVYALPPAEYFAMMVSTAHQILQMCKMAATKLMSLIRLSNIAVDQLVDPEYTMGVKTMIYMVHLTYLRDIVNRLYISVRYILVAINFLWRLSWLFRQFVARARPDVAVPAA